MPPDLAAEMVEQCQHLLDQLPNDEFREIVRMEAEGYSRAEIASSIGRSIPTVDRRLRRIREIWATNQESENR